MIYVLGGDHRQALRWSRDLEGRVCILHTPNQLLGCERGSDIYLIGTWYARKDLNDWDRIIDTYELRKRFPANEEGF